MNNLPRLKNNSHLGIRQWHINQYTFPIMIHKITPSVDYNYIQLVVETLETQSKELTNQRSIKVPNYVNPINKKTLL